MERLSFILFVYLFIYLSIYYLFICLFIYILCIFNLFNVDD